MGLIMKGGRTPVRVTASQRSQASMTWATLNTSVTMTCDPFGHEGLEGFEAGHGGRDLGRGVRRDGPRRAALGEDGRGVMSASGAPCSETKPSRPLVRS